MKIIKKIIWFCLYVSIGLFTIFGAMAEEIPSVQLEDTSGISYLNVFNYNTSVHNNLTELQGGLAPNQYYHLNYAQYLLIGSLLGNESYFPFLNVDWINGTNATFLNITKNGIEVATLDDLTVQNLTVVNIIKVRNIAGETAVQGSAMKYDDYNAGVDRFNVVYANISDIDGHADCILLQTLSDNANGECVVLGMIENMDTSIWNNGDHLWLNNTDGSMTDDPNTSAVCVQHLGIVLRSHATVGSFYARPEVRCAIDGWNTTYEMFNAVNNGSFAPFGYGDEWNKTYADTLYTNNTDTNTNCSVANTCSAIVYNTNTSWIVKNQNYNTTAEMFNAVNNGSFAPFNYNPFDQVLNTTSNIQFNNATINSVIFDENKSITFNNTCMIFKVSETYIDLCE